MLHVSAQIVAVGTAAGAFLQQVYCTELKQLQACGMARHGLNSVLASGTDLHVTSCWPATQM